MFLKKIFQAATDIGNTKMVLLVRTDLNMGRGKIASQCAHAAVILYDQASTGGSASVRAWMLSGQPKIVLKVDSNGEPVLRELYDRAKSNDLNACLVCDAGRTQVSGGTVTVLGIGPNNIDAIDKLTKDFKLL